jgi:hypothetical protein
VLYEGEVGDGVIGAHAAFVITEDHIHDPVQTVFYRAMIATGPSCVRTERTRYVALQSGTGLPHFLA